jgi:hypothetical protein
MIFDNSKQVESYSSPEASVILYESLDDRQKIYLENAFLNIILLYAIAAIGPVLVLITGD